MPFNGRFVENVIEFAGQRGANVATLYEIAGHEPVVLREGTVKIEPGSFNRLFRTAMEMTGDPDLGLHGGEYLNLSAAGLILQIMQSSPTLARALQYVCDFANLGCSSLPMHLEVTEQDVSLILTPEPLWLGQAPEVVEQVVDGVFAFTMREFATLIRQRYRPLSVHYSFPETRDRLERERVFGAPLFFGEARNRICLPREILAQPVLTQDFELLQLLVQHAEKKLQEDASGTEFNSIVRRTIFKLLKPQFPTIEEVAANLNQSVRTLQRKLKEEGKTFKEVLETIKYEFATSYLQKPELSVAEVAELLQYSETSGFIRSFKRWTGKTPMQFRAELPQKF